MITIFQHISKTGGSTMRTVVRRQYDHLFLYGGGGDPLERLKNMPRKEVDTLDCIYGHLPFGIHRHLARPYRYFTMVREPVDRAVSIYYHILSKPQHPLHNQVTQQRMSLRDCVEEFATFHNNQTRYLTGITHHDPLERSMVEQAKRNLEEYYVVVGTTDHYDASLLLMRRRLGWAWSGIQYKRQNVSRDRPSIEALTPETVQVIRERSQLDIEVYRYARESLERELEKEGLSLQLERRYYQGAKQMRYHVGRLNRFARRCKKAVQRRWPAGVR